MAAGKKRCRAYMINRTHRGCIIGGPLKMALAVVAAVKYAAQAADPKSAKSYTAGKPKVEDVRGHPPEQSRGLIRTHGARAEEIPPDSPAVW